MKEMERRFERSGWTIFGRDENGFGITAKNCNGAVVVISEETIGRQVEKLKRLAKDVDRLMKNKTMDVVIISNTYLLEVYHKGKLCGEVTITPSVEDVNIMIEKKERLP